MIHRPKFIDVQNVVTVIKHMQNEAVLLT